MLIRDRHIDPNAKFIQHVIQTALAPAVSLTNAVLSLLKWPIDVKVLRAAVYARAVAGTVSISAVLSRAEGILVAHTSLSIATTTTSYRSNGTMTYLAAGVVTTKAATDNQAFSAAHVVNQNSWGAILVQIDAGGTYSTKVTAATQAGFTTEAQAIAALPAADSLKVAVGYITVRKTDGNFTANTTALNAANTTVNYYVVAARTCFTAAITPLAGREVVATLSSTALNVEAEDDEFLAVLATTDGTGALTDGRLNLTVRPQNVRGDPA